MAKKVHVGANGSTPCMRRVSMHVRHSMPVVVSRETFLTLPVDRQCRKCLARIAAEEATQPPIN